MAEYNGKYTGQEIDAALSKANSAYQKTIDGIPKSDLSKDVQTSLEKADTAIQDISSKQDKLIEGEGISIVGNTISCTHDKTLYKIVTVLPEVGEEHKIYLILSDESEEYNIYTEYAYINGTWEQLGKYKATIDLTPYALKEDIPQNVLTYDAQELTDAQKSQVKSNLGIINETDPVFRASAAAGITTDDINKWNNKSDKNTIVEFASNIIALDANKYYRLTSAQTSLSITLNAPTDTTIKNEYFIEFPYSSGSVSFPVDVIWENGETPTFEGGKTYQVSIVNNLAMYAVFG